MRFVTYHARDRESFGILIDVTGETRIVDLPAAFAHVEKAAGRDHHDEAIASRYGADLVGFIERQDDAMPVARTLEARAKEGTLPVSVTHSAGSVRLLAPIPRPPSMRDGYAFRQHVATARKNRGLDMIPEFDQFPVFYFTNHHGVTGPGDVEVQKLHQDRLDFELEAAIVVGRRGKNLRAATADAHVFGLTIMNDWSARALQIEEMKLSLGPAKGKDFATSLGPWLVTLDELANRTVPGENGNAYDMAMTATVNGAQVSSGNLRDMTWTFAQILERASYGATLHVGDVIGSGTVGTGCFLELNGSGITKNQWLKPGDEVTLAIDGLGELTNRIVAAVE